MRMAIKAQKSRPNKGATKETREAQSFSTKVDEEVITKKCFAKVRCKSFVFFLKFLAWHVITAVPFRNSSLWPF